MERIASELARIGELLNGGRLTVQQYQQLYAAQQGIAWVANADLAKSPVDTIMENLIQAPITDTPAS